MRALTGLVPEIHDHKTKQMKWSSKKQPEKRKVLSGESDRCGGTTLCCSVENEVSLQQRLFLTERQMKGWYESDRQGCFFWILRSLSSGSRCRRNSSCFKKLQTRSETTSGWTTRSWKCVKWQERWSWTILQKNVLEFHFITITTHSFTLYIFSFI